MSSIPLRMPTSLKRALHWGGSSLALISLVFVAVRLRSYWFDLDFSRVNPLLWTQISGFALIYGSANLLPVLAWWHLLIHLGASVTRLAAIRIYGISQLAKYIPGNIFHLAGRQALGMLAGMSARILAKSTILDFGTMAVAGSLFGCLMLPLLLPGYLELASVFLFFGSAIFIAVLLKNTVGYQPVWAFFWHMLFLAISGAVFVALLNLVADADGMSFVFLLTIGGAYIFAWLIGLLTPGAPAGLGVREMILMLLLNGIIDEADLLMVILLGRLVTVAGDLMFFVATSLIPEKFYESRKVISKRARCASNQAGSGTSS